MAQSTICINKSETPIIACIPTEAGLITIEVCRDGDIIHRKVTLSDDSYYDRPDKLINSDFEWFTNINGDIIVIRFYKSNEFDMLQISRRKME